MKYEELLSVREALRKGEFQIVLQNHSNPKKNKQLIYNGNSSLLGNEKPIIYLVEK